MINLPDECPNTIEHALIHIMNILRSQDHEQTIHDINIAAAILLNVMEMRTGVTFDPFKIHG